MTQTRHPSRHLLLSSYGNVNMIQEHNIRGRSERIPDIAEHMGINRSAVIQVGRQLATIGDECNRMRHGKLEDSLFRLAKGMAANMFHNYIWKNSERVLKGFGRFLNRGWRKKMVEYCWILWVPFNHVCQKYVAAILLAVLMWLLVAYGLKD